MPLTRPRFSQFDTTISSISDPITVLNKSSTLANIDIGFIMNRNGGALSNVAIIWQESAGAFALAFTSNTGEITGSVSNSNIAVNIYANLILNSLTANSVNTNGNVTATYFLGSGALLTGLPASYSNVNVVAYTQSMGFTNYSNVNVVAYTQTQSYTNYSNVNVKAYTESMGFQNYGNVNVASYLSSGLASSLNTSGNISGTGLSIFGNTTHGLAGAISGQFHSFVGNITQTSSGGAIYINTTGNVLAASFVGSGSLLTALPGYAYGNVNVKAYTESMGFANYSNVNVAAYTQTQSYTNYSNVNLTAYLGGAVTVGGNLTVQGNLIVQGTTTTVNSTTLDVTDLNITVAKGAATAAAANGAGLTVDGASATLLYTSATDTWNINKGLVVSSAGTVIVNNTQPSTSTTSGALQVAGGVGIAGNLALGRFLYADGSPGSPGQALLATASGLSWGTTGSTPFTLTSDFGLVTDNVTVSEDEGNLDITSTTLYDMGNIATTGPVFPDALVLPSFSAMPTAVQAGQAVFDTANNAPRFAANTTTWNDPIGYNYILDDISSQFNGITKSFVLTVNGEAAYQVNNPYQIELYIGNSPVTPTRRYVDYFNLPELAVFNRGYIISSVNNSTLVGALNIGSGNTIVFSTAPSYGMSFYGKVNTGPTPPFTFTQTPFSAINIMLGS